MPNRQTRASRSCPVKPRSFCRAESVSAQSSLPGAGTSNRRFTAVSFSTSLIRSSYRFCDEASPSADTTENDSSPKAVRHALPSTSARDEGQQASQPSGFPLPSASSICTLLSAPRTPASSNRQVSHRGRSKGGSCRPKRPLMTVRTSRTTLCRKAVSTNTTYSGNFTFLSIEITIKSRMSCPQPHPVRRGDMLTSGKGKTLSQFSSAFPRFCSKYCGKEWERGVRHFVSRISRESDILSHSSHWQAFCASLRETNL